MDARFRPTTPQADPLVEASVRAVRDRFGAEGLRDLIALARAELGRVQEAERLAAAADATSAFDVADTQAWRAYTEADETDSEDRRR